MTKYKNIKTGSNSLVIKMLIYLLMWVHLKKFETRQLDEKSFAEKLTPQKVVFLCLFHLEV